jgi:phage minor structural protein
MGQLYVYEPWPTAVDTMGLCGPLVPKKAVCTHEKNGDFRLDIEHPIDPYGKWQSLVAGNLIRTDVPLRTVPIIQYGDLTYTYYIWALKHYKVKSTATLTQRSVFSGHNSNPNITMQAVRFAILPPGEDVYEAGTTAWMGYESWSLITWKYGRGWILSSALDYVDQLTLPMTRNDIETVVPSPRTRPQLFRITSTRESDTGISVQARHVSYDIAGDIVSVIGGSDSEVAIDIASQISADSRSVTNHASKLLFTNSETSRPLQAKKNIGAIEGMLAPSDSVTATWSTYLLRDNWIYTFLTDPAYSEGYTIEYGKNLRGITVETDYSNIIDAIKPIGQTTKGKPLEVPTNTYTVDGNSVAVAYGFVNSPNYSYPTQHQAVLDLGAQIKATGTTSSALNAAYVKLIRAALVKFAEEQCDLPEVTLSVDFVHLGDTAEYAQYRDLERLFLYDTVRVRHPRLGIDVTTQVNKTEWDCLLDRYNSIELGSVRKNYARTRFASWQVPGLETLSAYVDTISSAI